MYTTLIALAICLVIVFAAGYGAVTSAVSPLISGGGAIVGLLGIVTLSAKWQRTETTALSVSTGESVRADDADSASSEAPVSEGDSRAPDEQSTADAAQTDPEETLVEAVGDNKRDNLPPRVEAHLDSLDMALERAEQAPNAAETRPEEVLRAAIDAREKLEDDLSRLDGTAHATVRRIWLDTGDRIDQLQSRVQEHTARRTRVSQTIDTAASHFGTGKQRLFEGEFDEAGAEFETARRTATEAIDLAEASPLVTYHAYADTSLNAPELDEVEGIGESRLQSLRESEIESLDSLIAATQEELADVDEIPLGTLQRIRTNAFEAVVKPLRTLRSEIDSKTRECSKHQDKVETTQKTLEKARSKIKTARNFAADGKYTKASELSDAAEETLDTLPDSALAVTDDQSDAAASLRAEIGDERQNVQGESLVESLSSNLDRADRLRDQADDALDASDYEQAAQLYGDAKSYLVSAKVDHLDIEDHDEAMSPIYRDEVTDRLETVDSRRKRAKITAEMAEVEELVEDTNELFENEEHRIAAAGYRAAIDRYTGLLSEIDQSEQWELERRIEELDTYLRRAQAAANEEETRQRSEVEGHLDRIDELLERSRQELEVDDPTAARESSQQAADLLETVKQRIERAGIETTSLAERVEEATEELAWVEDRLETNDSPAVTKRDFLSALQNLSTAFGEPPRSEFMDRYGPYSTDAYVDAFGSWENALDAANVGQIDAAARARRKYTRVDILDAIVELTKNLGRPPSRQEMNEKGAMSSTTAANRFGEWERALSFAEAADSKETPDMPVDEATPSGSGPDEEVANDDLRVAIRDELQRLIKRSHDGMLPRPTLAADREMLNLDRVLSEYPSLLAALEDAGVDAGTAEELRTRHLDELGRLTHSSGLKKSHVRKYSEFEVEDFVAVFGSWESATSELEASDPDETSSFNDSFESDGDARAIDTDNDTDTDRTAPSRFDLVMGLMTVAEAVEGSPEPSDLEETGFTLAMFEREFGSWENALRAAGLEEE